MSSTVLSSRAASRSISLFVLAAGALCAAEPGSTVGLTELGRGIGAYNARDFNGAILHLQAARGVARLSDYVTYHLAYAQLVTGNVDGALETLTAYRGS